MDEKSNNKQLENQNIKTQPIEPISPPKPDPITPPPVKKSPLVPILITIIIILLGFTGFLSYQFIFKPNQELKAEQDSSIPNLPTPNPTSSTELNLSLPNNTFENCGTNMPKVRFSVSPPSSWTSTPIDGSEIYQAYRFQNQEGWLKVTCGTGFGGGCESENQTTITINGKAVLGCYKYSNLENDSLWATYISSPDKDVSFSFTSNLDKQTIDQILSTFKFTQTESQSNPTAEWQTHTASIYQINYPKDVKTQSHDNFFSLYQWGPTQKEGTELYDGYSINITTKEMGMPFSDYVSSKINEINYAIIATVTNAPTPITINNLTGLTYDVEGLGTWKEILIPDQEGVMVIEISVTVPDPGNLNFQQTVDAILNTLTLVDNL